MKRTLGRVFNAITFLCISLICVIGLGFGLRASGVTGENFVTKLLAFGGTTSNDDYMKGPERSKKLISNEDGSYRLELTVKGDSEIDTHVDKKANVIIVMDTSGSMEDPADYSNANIGTRYTADKKTVGRFAFNNYYWRLYYRTGTNGNYKYYREGTGPEAETRHDKVWYPDYSNGSVRWVDWSSGTRYNFKNNNNARIDETIPAVQNAIDVLLGQNTAEVDDMVEVALVAFGTNARYTSPTSATGEWTKGSKDGTAATNLKTMVETGLIPYGSTNWDEALYYAQQLAANKNDGDNTYIIFFSDGEPTQHNGSSDGVNSHNHNNGGISGGGNTPTTADINAAYYEANQIHSKGYTLYGLYAYGAGTNGQNYMKTLASYANYGNTSHVNTIDGEYYFSADNEEGIRNAFSKIVSYISSTVGYADVTINDGTTAKGVTTSTGIVHLLTVDEDSYKYYKDGVEWKEAPKAKLNDKGEVVWDLGDDVLDDDVVYKVTFDVWPSQYTLDLIADLKNGKTSYSSLPKEITDYLTKTDKGEYELATNTVATIEYTDTRTTDGKQTAKFKNPPAVETDSYTLNIEKRWANGLDPERYSAEPVQLGVYRDGKAIDGLLINSLGFWKNKTEIAVGIMKHDPVTNTIRIYETGHEYSFAEPTDLSYHWELDSQVVRPMLINNVLKVLIRDDKTTMSSDHETITKDGVEREYFKIDKKAYYIDESITQLIATNNRRSYFEFSKAVNGEDIPADAKFKYTVKVENSLANLEDNINSDDDEIWFSVYDTVNKTTVTELETSAVVANNEGYYKVPSGTEFTVELEAGWNLRIVNLPINSTYSVEEIEMANGFEFEKVEGPGTISNRKVTGTITEWNKAYSVAYTNKYVLKDVVVTKNWNDNNDQDGIRPPELALVLKANGDVVNATPVVTKDGNTWTYTYKALPKDKTYTVEEPTLPDGYTPSVEGLTITNTHRPATAAVVATKTWKDDSDREALRPESLELVLKANGDVVNATPVVTKDGNTWTYTYADLDVNKGGKPIVYTIEEENVPRGYEKTKQEGLTVENTHEIKTVSLSVLKEWDDGNNRDNKRPTSVTVKLLADGTEVASFDLNKDNKWTATTDKLPVNKRVVKEGVVSSEPIVYTWTEESLGNGYTLTGNEVDKDNENLTILTNTRPVDTTQATIKKVWNDDSNRDGKRPTELVVKLNGETHKLTAANALENDKNQWVLTVDKLPLRDNDGNDITYTWVEELDDDSTKVGYKQTGNSKEGTITTITNSKDNETVPVVVTKNWVDGGNRDNSRADIRFVLYANDKVVNAQQPTPVKNGDTWTYSYGNLNKYENGQPITYTVKEVGVPDGYTPSVEGLTITNTRPVEMTEITVVKSWDDAFDQDRVRPQELLVKVMNGEEVVASHKLNAKEDWTYVFTDLYMNENGHKIEYTVVEEEITGYAPQPVVTSTYNHVIKNEGEEDVVIPGTKYVLKNSYAPKTVSYSGTKKWQDGNNQDGIRPSSVTIVLIEGDEIVARQEVSEKTDWKYSFTVPMNRQGVPIQYELDELSVDGYDAFISDDVVLEDGTITNVITNVHEVETVDVVATKEWDDGRNQDGIRPPKVTFILENDKGVVIENNSIELDGTPDEVEAGTDPSRETGEWKVTYKKLPKYTNPTGVTEKQELINYSVSEQTTDVIKGTKLTDNAAGTYRYEVSGNQTEGYVIKNIHTPEKINIETSKVWADHSDNDDVRPDEITVNLVLNGTVLESKTVTAKENWSAKFSGYDKYSGGKLINYEITEDTVPGYRSSVNGYEITNTHDLLTTDVTVTKEWDDGEDQDGVRPESVNVQLYADGEPVGNVVTLPNDGKWSYTWSNVQKIVNGRPIVYSVLEVEEAEETEEGEEEATGYYPTYDDVCPVDKENNVTKCVITNHYDPEKTTVTFVKAWDDRDDQDGIRPDSIKVQLYADGEKVGEEVEVSDDWTYAFEGLDKYRDSGVEIEYTVKEVDTLEGYTATAEGIAEGEEVNANKTNNYTITNKHEIETVDVLGNVYWDDVDDQDGLRPEDVEICLYADGELVECKEVTEEDGKWTYAFEDLDKNEDGEEIEYTVTEKDIDSYEIKQDKYDFTNKHVPDEGEVLGENEEFCENCEVAGEKKESDNPETGDTILPFALLLLTSLGGISVTAKKIVDREK